MHFVPFQFVCIFVTKKSTILYKCTYFCEESIILVNNGINNTENVSQTST